MSQYMIQINNMLKMLPENEQRLAMEFVKQLVKTWDPDYTKVTPSEYNQIAQAEQSGFIEESDIDWDNLSKYTV